MSKYRQIAEDIFEDAPDWHSTEDLVDAVEVAIENAVEAQKRACIEIVQKQKARTDEIYAACQPYNLDASLARSWMFRVLEYIASAILFDP